MSDNEIYNKPIVVEKFADNGHHSHWVLVDPKTGENLWSEEPSDDMERIICAAIWYKELDKMSDKWVPNVVGFMRPRNIDRGIVICGYRHPSCMYTMIAITGKKSFEKECGEHVQGFLTNKNRFVNREEAVPIFKASTKREPYYSGTRLYSEDLY